MRSRLLLAQRLGEGMASRSLLELPASSRLFSLGTEKLSVGDEFRMQRLFTQDEVDGFVWTTGDFNPLHSSAGANPLAKVRSASLRRPHAPPRASRAPSGPVRTPPRAPPCRGAGGKRGRPGPPASWCRGSCWRRRSRPSSEAGSPGPCTPPRRSSSSARASLGRGLRPSYDSGGGLGRWRCSRRCACRGTRGGRGRCSWRGRLWRQCRRARRSGAGPGLNVRRRRAPPPPRGARGDPRWLSHGAPSGAAPGQPSRRRAAPHAP